MMLVLWGGAGIPGNYLSGKIGEGRKIVLIIYITIVDEDEGVVWMSGRDDDNAHF